MKETLQNNTTSEEKGLDPERDLFRDVAHLSQESIEKVNEALKLWQEIQELGETIPGTNKPKENGNRHGAEELALTITVKLQTMSLAERTAFNYQQMQLQLKLSGD